MRLETVIASDGCNSTPDEPWSALRARRLGHWYEASTDFAVMRLGDGEGKKCLVIGSPIFEAKELMDKGWNVIYLDVRKPPVVFMDFVQCDASSMPFDDESFDAVSTACVLTHVGLGRYGDPEVENGDEKAIMEIARVMKPGASAAITFGAVVDAPAMVRMGTAHRIYTVREAHRMLEMAGLSLEDLAVWSTAEKRWRREDEQITTSMSVFDYLSTFVRKPC